MKYRNAAAIMVPTFGKKTMLGSNPIAFSMSAEPYPFLFDSSATVVTRGKLEIYQKLEKSLPNEWAIDSAGNVSTDAARVLNDIIPKAGGGILPLGGALGLTSNHTYTGWC